MFSQNKQPDVHPLFTTPGEPGVYINAERYTSDGWTHRYLQQVHLPIQV